MNARVVLWVIAVVLAAAIGRWTAPAGESPVAIAEAGSVSATAASPAAAPTSARITSDEPPTPPVRSMATQQVAPASSKLAFDAASYLAALPQQLDDLAGRASSGDARALTELADWVEYCSQVSIIQRIAQSPDGLQRMGDIADASVANYFIQVDALCHQWTSRHNWLAAIRDQIAGSRGQPAAAAGASPTSTPRSVSEALRQRAADGGDEISQAQISDTRRRQSCGNVTATTPAFRRRPYDQCVQDLAREHLATIIARRDPQVLAAVPQIMATYGFSVLNRSEFLLSQKPGDIDALWTLVGCHYGLNCGATGRALRFACAQLGACAYRDYRDYVADRVLPPAQMRQLAAKLPRLIALVEAGNVDAILRSPPRFPGS